jgi:hypothetical protein
MSISCGHCHGHHDTVTEVRMCSGQQNREELQAHADLLAPGLYVHPDGRKFQVRRSGKSGHNYAMLFSVATKHYEYAPGQITSIRPEYLQAEAKDPREGVYRNTAGEIRSVKKAVHGSGQMVARRLVVPAEDDEDNPKPYWVYLGLARDHIAGFVLMTLEEAMAFGQLYGVCCDCGIVLTNPVSIERGIGPICGAKENYFRAPIEAPEWTI